MLATKTNYATAPYIYVQSLCSEMSSLRRGGIVNWVAFQFSILGCRAVAPKKYTAIFFSMMLSAGYIIKDRDTVTSYCHHCDSCSSCFYSQ